MVKYSVELLDRLRESPLSDHVSPHVKLQKRGSTYLGLCPFHEEKTPSFSVNDTKGVYYCFGCGNGGDVFTWYTNHQKLSFPEAVREIARVSGIELPASDGSPDPRLRGLAVNKAALEYFTRQDHVDVVYDYLTKQRKLTDDTIKHFGLGWAPDSWNVLRDHLYHEKGFSLEEIGRQGLIDATDEKKQSREIHDWYSFYRNRLMIPVHNHLGDVVGFAARALTEEDENHGKYLNSMGSTIFGKPLYDKDKILFGLNDAWPHIIKAKEAILTEGYFHIISAHQAGINNVVGKSGSALTDEQLRLLSRITANVHIIEDGDGAGVKATKKEMRMMFAMGITSSFTALNPKEDLDDLVRFLHHDREAIVQSLKKTDFVDYILSTLSYKQPIVAEDEVKALNEIYDFFSLESDKTKIFIHMKHVAERLNIPAQALVDRYVRKLKAKNNRMSITKENLPLPQEDIMNIASKYVLDVFLARGKFTKQHFDIPPESDFFDEDTRQFYQLLIEKNNDPLIGKSFKLGLGNQPDFFVQDEMDQALEYMKRLYREKELNAFPERIVAMLKTRSYNYNLALHSSILRNHLKTKKKQQLLNAMVSAQLSGEILTLEKITDELVGLIDGNGKA